MNLKKAVVLLGGLGTRFLPLSKVVPKELWPLVDKPVLQYLLEEVREAGIEEVVFVVSSKKSLSIKYLNEENHWDEILEERQKEERLEGLKELRNLISGFSFSFVVQKEPLGDGHALLQARSKIGDEPFGLLFCDDLIWGKKGGLAQLAEVFKSTERSIIGLYPVEKNEISSFGVVREERIAKRFYKVKGIVEKPAPKEAPSNLAVVGKYIFTPDIFDFLKEEKLKEVGKMVEETGEIVLAEGVAAALKAGKTFYGYAFEGEWLRCGNKRDWLVSHLFMTLKDPRFGPGIKKFLKEA